MVCSAVYRFSPRTLALEVISYRTIQPGEEITISCKSHSTPITFLQRTPVLTHQDAPTTLSTDQRRQYLHQNFHLSCSCALCRSPPDSETVKESDHARQRVGELKATLTQAISERYFENALVIAHEWREMAEQEGIPPLMAEYYDIAARLSFDVGDLASARRYALLSLDAWTRLGSTDDAELESAREFLRMATRLPRDARLEKKGVANIF